jgi:hypothetical protein
MPSFDLAPPTTNSLPVPSQVVSLSQFTCVTTVKFTDRRGEGVGRTQIIQRQESLALYKSFNTLSKQWTSFYPVYDVYERCIFE